MTHRRIDIHIEKLVDDRIMRRACDMTRKPGMKPSEMTLEKIYRCEHSPMRTQTFWIELRNIFTFVSVHIVRHKYGVEHFVESNRKDRGGKGDEDRYTPVNHGLFANAQALVNMSLKRLCYASADETVATWMKLKKAMRKVDPALSDHMVPVCVYRNGICPELRECKPGLEAVLRAYAKER
jgi:hypothetical protein